MRNLKRISAAAAFILAAMISAPAGVSASAEPAAAITKDAETVEILNISDDDYSRKDIADNDTGETDVLNLSGTGMPDTGGIGTTIFYVGGGIIVTVALVLLITKKRMGKSDDEE